jgi:hypothetical protein
MQKEMRSSLNCMTLHPISLPYIQLFFTDLPVKLLCGVGTAPHQFNGGIDES